MLSLSPGNHQAAFECLGTALAFDPKNSRAILAAGSMMQVGGRVSARVRLFCITCHVSIVYGVADPPGLRRGAGQVQGGRPDHPRVPAPVEQHRDVLLWEGEVCDYLW